MASRVSELFSMRLARRRGEVRPDESQAIADLDSYGESIGIMSAAPKMSAPPMPGRPVTDPKPAMPSGDALASMAPPGAGAQVATRSNTGGIPALDALSERPSSEESRVDASSQARARDGFRRLTWTTADALRMDG